jgi:hypothetical protein
MQKQIAAAACDVVLVAVAWAAVPRGADARVWNPRAAAGYLDQRARHQSKTAENAEHADRFFLRC